MALLGQGILIPTSGTGKTGARKLQVAGYFQMFSQAGQCPDCEPGLLDGRAVESEKRLRREQK